MYVQGPDCVSGSNVAYPCAWIWILDIVALTRCSPSSHFSFFHLFLGVEVGNQYLETSPFSNVAFTGLLQV